MEVSIVTMNVAKWGMGVVAKLDGIVGEENAVAGRVKQVPFAVKPLGVSEPGPERSAQREINCPYFDSWAITVKEVIS